MTPLRAAEGDGPLGQEVPAEVPRFAALSVEQRQLLLHVHDLLGAIAYGTVVLGL